MWSWIKSLFARLKKTPGPEEPAPDLGVYRPLERLIFKYFDGQREVTTDPVVTYKRILPMLAELNAKWGVAFDPKGPEGAAAAHDEVVGSLHRVFGTVPLKDGGLTDTEVVELFNQFMTYCLHTGISVPAEPVEDETEGDS